MTNKAANYQMEGHFMRIHKRRPKVTVKCATSADGKIAFPDGTSQGDHWISGGFSRAFAHYIRAISDGILVGANTIRVDNPSLNCRLKGMENRAPKIFVANGSGDIKKRQGTSPAPRIFGTGADVHFLTKQSIGLDKSGQVNLEIALLELATMGIKTLMVEGGGRLITSLLEANLVDEIMIVRSGVFIGEGGIPAVANLQNAKSFSRVLTTEMGPDEILEVFRHQDLPLQLDHLVAPCPVEMKYRKIKGPEQANPAHLKAIERLIWNRAAVKS